MKDYIDELKQKSEMDPSKHDGSYELVTAVVKAYGNVTPEVLDFHDLNCIYLMTIGTWKHGYDKKEQSINESHITGNDKKDLISLLYQIKNRVENKLYENCEQNQPSCGMFGTGFYSFEKKTDKDSVQRFVKLCLDILPLDNEEQIFNITETALKIKIKGMESASISQILHCLKPFVFPILNGYALKRNLFARMGVESKNFLNSDFYVANCRKIKGFRDSNFNFKNYRIIDLCEVGNGHDEGEMDMSEKMSNYVNLLEDNHNIILHGAPGTGKTYLAKEIASEMIFGVSQDKLTDEQNKQFNEQVDFVQFHQSYDYTDFVEGLRPAKGTEDGKIGFERKDGVFKKFCAKAFGEVSVESDNIFESSWQKLLEKVHDDVKNGGLTKIGSWEYSLSSKDSLKYSSLNSPSKYTFTINKQNVFDAYRGIQARPSGAFQKDMDEVVSYMKENCGLCDYKSDQRNEKKNFVFIIDEINRGEMSKIFGELFYSIDPGYRGVKGAVLTQYANMQGKDEPNEFDRALNATDYGHFFVPENVYIIGTMNDIDRSVESMDFAMRRRFAFKEVKADDRVAMLYDDKNGLGDLADAAKRCMKALNNAIWNPETKEGIPGLSSAYHIGPAYFLKLKNYAEEENPFEKLWEYHIAGVLKEYLRGMDPDEKHFNALKSAYDAEVVK